MALGVSSAPITTASVARVSEASTAGLSAGAIERSHYADPAGVVGRRLAWNAAANIGRIYTSWGIGVSGSDFAYRFKCRYNGGTGTGAISGRAAVDFPWLFVEDGVIEFKNYTTLLASSGYTLPVDRDVYVEAEWLADGTGATLKVDGEIVAQPTWAAQTWGTAKTTWYIGSRGSAEWFPGLLWDVTLEVTGADSETCFHALDGNGLNTHTDPTRPDATLNDWVQWTHINTTGAANPLPVVGPITTTVSESTEVTHSGATSYTGQFDTVESSEYGRHQFFGGAGKLSASPGSLITLTWAGTLTLDGASTGDGQADIQFFSSSGGSPNTPGLDHSVAMTAGDVRPFHHSRTWYTTGSVDPTLYQVRLQNCDALDTWKVAAGATFSITEQAQ